MATATLAHARATVSERLRERREEIEAAALARTYAVSDPGEVKDPEYAEGLRAAVAAALDYGIAAVELGEDRAPPPPDALLSQARLAARAGIGLDTVLRRYFAGFALFAEFAMQEAEAAPFPEGISPQRLLGAQAAQFDRLIAAISEAYTKARESRFRSPEQRRAERVRRLLAGERLDFSDLAYDLDRHHLGVVASGPEAPRALQDLAKALDRRLLLIRHDEEQVWAWFGGQLPIDPGGMQSRISQRWPAGVPVAIGEPAQGLPGWRLTHRQARAALPIALHSPGRLVRYIDVALLASMLRDDLLATSLREIYLAPLAEERDQGETSRETLRAYLATGQNVTSAAAVLGVTRNTVANRLRAIEDRLQRPLSACTAEVDAALQLEELGYLQFEHCG